MSMVQKSISMTDQQADWIKAQIAAGHYASESEFFRALISEHQMREQETPEEIESIRAALAEAEESIKREGCSRRTVTEIFEEAEAIHKERHS